MFHSSSILLRNLMRLSQMVYGDFSEVAESMRIVEDYSFSSFYDFEGLLLHIPVLIISCGKYFASKLNCYLLWKWISGNDNIRVQGASEFLIASKNQLGPFGDQDAIDGSAAHIIEDIYPIAPTIDLQPERIYNLDNITGK